MLSHSTHFIRSWPMTVSITERLSAIKEYNKPYDIIKIMKKYNIIIIILVIIITVVLLVLQIRTTTLCPVEPYINSLIENDPNYFPSAPDCRAIEIGWPLKILSYDSIESNPGEINFEKPSQFIVGLLVDIAVIVSPTIAFIIFRTIKTKKSRKTE